VADDAHRRLLALIGLGMRARSVVIGVDSVRAAALGGKLALAVVAPDAARNSREKVLPLLAAKKIEVIEGPSADALGAAIGRASIAAIGVVDRELANGIRSAAADATRVV
jgi:ribosomal protein L7Ae-like RNA K-turn-binding protein